MLPKFATKIFASWLENWYTKTCNSRHEYLDHVNLINHSHINKIFQYVRLQFTGQLVDVITLSQKRICSKAVMAT